MGGISGALTAYGQRTGRGEGFRRLFANLLSLTWAAVRFGAGITQAVRELARVRRLQAPSVLAKLQLRLDSASA